MNNYKKLLILLLILLGLGIGIYYSEIKSNSTLIPNEKTSATVSASLSINDGTGAQGSEVPGYVGKTALEATQSVAKVEMGGTGTNAFITGINGRKADTKKHEFWELLVNGKPASVGAGSYIIQNGDSLEWHITTY